MSSSHPLDALYGATLTLLRPVVPFYLRRRLHQGKEDPLRLNERYGLATLPRPAGRLLWIHGASVGETLSALPLIEQLLATHPQLHILVTSGTRTSADLLARRLPPRALHQYIPLDVPAYTRRFMAHWRPDATIWLESELWPALLRDMRLHHVPAARLNARLTARSAHSWQRFSGWFRHLLQTFAITLPISAADGERLEQAGAPNLIRAGNLKFTAPAPQADSGELAELKVHIGTRPVWLFANSHPGEEDMARRVHQILTRRWPDLLTVIVPRHPARADDVEMMLGGAVPRRSRHEWPRPDHPFYLGDTLGEMALFYRAIPVVVVGGSFTPKGGHNPLEAAQCGSATLIGPDTSKCADIVDELQQAGALVRMAGEQALTEELATLLARPDTRHQRAQAGLAASQRQAEIMAGTLAALAPLLQKLV